MWLLGLTGITAGDLSNEDETIDEGEEPSAGSDGACVPTSQVEVDIDGCIAMSKKKHNALGSIHLTKMLLILMTMMMKKS